MSLRHMLLREWIERDERAPHVPPDVFFSLLDNTSAALRWNRTRYPTLHDFDQRLSSIIRCSTDAGGIGAVGEDVVNSGDSDDSDINDSDGED